MPRLRVVKAGDDGDSTLEMTMAEAVEAVMRECTAAQPVSVLIAWESHGQMSVRALPDSIMVKKGFAETLYEFMFETEGSTED